MISTTDPRRRLLVTATALTTVVVLTRVPLPGVHHALYADWYLATPTQLPVSAALLDVAELGILPFVYAALLVELTAWALPALRGLRRTLEGRQQLLRWSVGLTLPLVALNAMALASGIGQMRLGSASLATSEPWLPALSLMAGTFLVVALARVIDTHGLGSGVLAVLVIPRLLASLEVVAYEGAPAVAACGFVCGVTAASSRLARHTGVAVPTSGLLPLAVLSLGVSTPTGLWLGGGLCAVLSLAFTPPHRIARTPAEWLRAVAGTGLFLLAIAWAARTSAPQLDLLMWALATAVVMDLVSEYRFRRDHGALVAVAVETRSWRAADLAPAFARQGVPLHPRNRESRPMLQVLAPFAPHALLVPEPHAQRAMGLLRGEAPVLPGERAAEATRPAEQAPLQPEVKDRPEPALTDPYDPPGT